MTSPSDLTRVTGSPVLDSDGGKIGTAREVYLDDATGQPAWVAVTAGLFGRSESLVPLAEARLTEDGLRVPYDRTTVTGAPRLGSSGHLKPQEEDELHRYYGLTAGPATVSGPAADDAMTRSEERLSVGTERHVTGRARLRKFVTTEIVTVEVPVRREEVRLVHDPVDGTDAGADDGEPYDGPPVQLAEGEHVVVLHEERPVVTTETVPVERVRLATETVTTTQAVSGEVRTEHIELEGDVDGDDGTPRT